MLASTYYNVEYKQNVSGYACNLIPWKVLRRRSARKKKYILQWHSSAWIAVGAKGHWTANILNRSTSEMFNLSEQA